MSSPKPPSACWTESSHSTARRIAGWSGGTPQASSAGRAAPPRMVAEAERAQSRRADRRIVDVGIDVVLVLERPPAGREIGNANGPVALDGDLFAQEVRAGQHELGMVGGDAAGAQREHG